MFRELCNRFVVLFVENKEVNALVQQGKHVGIWILIPNTVTGHYAHLQPIFTVLNDIETYPIEYEFFTNVCRINGLVFTKKTPGSIEPIAFLDVSTEGTVYHVAPLIASAEPDFDKLLDAFNSSKTEMVGF